MRCVSPTRRSNSSARLRTALVELLRREGVRPTPRMIEQRMGRLLAGREIRRTLTELERLGARAEYLACDVTDTRALEAAASSRFQVAYAGVLP